MSCDPFMGREFIARDPRTGLPISRGTKKQKAMTPQIEEGPFIAIPNHEIIPLAMGEDVTTAATVASITDNCTYFGAPEDANTTNKLKTLFNYDCVYTRADTAENGDTSLLATAVINDNDKAIKGNQIQMRINLDTGSVEKVRAETSKIFGGLKANAVAG